MVAIGQPIELNNTWYFWCSNGQMSSKGCLGVGLWQVESAWGIWNGTSSWSQRGDRHCWFASWWSFFYVAHVSGKNQLKQKCLYVYLSNVTRDASAFQPSIPVCMGNTQRGNSEIHSRWNNCWLQKLQNILNNNRLLLKLRRKQRGH